MQNEPTSKRQRSGEKRGANSEQSYLQAMQQDPQNSGTAPLNFNETLLQAYGLTNQIENPAVVSTIQILYQNGSDALKRGLRHLTSSMAKKSTELSEKTRSLEEMSARLSEMQYNSEAELGALQVAFNDSKTKYNNLSEMVSELETKAAIADQLVYDKTQLEAHCHELRTQLSNKQRQLEELTPKETALQNASKIFNDPVDKVPIQYPVMQTNGLIIDQHKIISAWSKQGEVDDGYPYRIYICPVTKVPTSLARVNITLKIQEIATGLGMCLIPPMEFEFKGHEELKWTKFGLMDQLNIISKLCCMYTTRIQSSTVVLGNDQIYFNILLDKVDQSRSLSLIAQRCLCCDARR